MNSSKKSIFCLNFELNKRATQAIFNNFQNLSTLSKQTTMSDEATPDLIYFDPATPLTPEVLSQFDLDPDSIKRVDFTDEKGVPQYYHVGKLTYKGLPPYFIIEGECYGVQAADFKGKKDTDKDSDDDGPAPVPGMIKMVASDLASQSAAAMATPEDEKKKDKVRKRKLQCSMKLTEKPSPDEWTEQEKIIIEFINNGLRTIWTHVLCSRLNILNQVNPNLIHGVQESIASDFQDPEIIAKYNTEALQNEYFLRQIKKAVYSKFVKKVYRKKLKAQPGQKFDINANPYDLKSCPGLYPTIMNHIDFETKVEIVDTKFYQYVEGVIETEWPSLDIDGAIAYGRCFAKIGIRFDEPFLGTAALSPKLNCGEVMLGKKIAAQNGHRGRMIMAPPSVPRNQNLVTKVSVNPTPAAAPAPSTVVQHTPLPLGSGPPMQPIQGFVPVAAPPTQASNPIVHNLGPQPFNPNGATTLTPAQGMMFSGLMQAK